MEPYEWYKESIDEMIERLGPEFDQRPPGYQPRPKKKTPKVKKEMPVKIDYNIPRRATTTQQKVAVINRLGALWLQNPDLRLGQLIGNVYPCGRVCQDCQRDTGHRDHYNVEDFDLISRLEVAYGVEA